MGNLQNTWKIFKPDKFNSPQSDSDHPSIKISKNNVIFFGNGKYYIKGAKQGAKSAKTITKERKLKSSKLKEIANKKTKIKLGV